MAILADKRLVAGLVESQAGQSGRSGSVRSCPLPRLRSDSSPGRAITAAGQHRHPARPRTSGRDLQRLDPVATVLLGDIQLPVDGLDEVGGGQPVAWHHGADANADGDALAVRRL